MSSEEKTRVNPWGWLIGLMVLGGTLLLKLAIGEGVLGWIILGLGGLIFVLSLMTNGYQRTAVATPFVIIILILTIFAQSDEFGQAAFGERWPAVEQAVTDAITPLYISFSGVGETYKTGFQCLVDPIGCQRQFQPQTQSEGATFSVEVTGFDMAGPQNLQYVCEDRSVFVTVSNLGDRNVNNVLIDALDPVDIDNNNKKAGETELITCGKGTCVDDSLNPVACSQASACTIDQLFEGESVQIGVRYKIDLKDSGTEPRGHRVQLKANLSYDFDLTGRLDVAVARSDHYDFLASQGRLNRQTVSTTDTGGPVRLGLAVFNNEMPIRGGIDSTPILATLSNQGTGYIDTVKVAGIDASTISTGNGICDLRVDLDDAIQDTDKKQLQPQNVRETCLINLVDPEQETLTGAVSGQVTYRYAIERFQNIFVAYGAGDYCECANGDSIAGNEAEGGDLSCQEYCSDKGGVAGCFDGSSGGSGSGGTGTDPSDEDL